MFCLLFSTTVHWCTESHRLNAISLKCCFCTFGLCLLVSLDVRAYSNVLDSSEWKDSPVTTTWTFPMCTNKDHEEIVSCIENLWDQLQRQCRTWVWKVSKCPVLLTKSGSRYQQEACEGGVFITSQLTLECDVDISIFITNLIRMLQYAVKIQQNTHVRSCNQKMFFHFYLRKDRTDQSYKRYPMNFQSINQPV